MIIHQKIQSSGSMDLSFFLPLIQTLELCDFTQENGLSLKI